MSNETINTPEVLDYNYKIHTLDEVLIMDLPKTEWLLYPFIQQKGLSLLYAERGAGKTFMAMAMACAVASGFDFLKFTSPTPRKVLYIDGEMTNREIKERFQLLIHGFARDGKIVNSENIQIFGSDFQDPDVNMPDIAKENGQTVLERYLDGIDLIILDNIYALYNAGKENDADSWQTFNKWSRGQRNKGRSVLWIHHTGKDASKGPRGSSAIEIFMNSSLALETDKGHKQADGAVVSVEYHKSRGVAGAPLKEFAVKLESCETDIFGNSAALHWIFTKSKKEVELSELKKMKTDGKTPKEISEITGIPLKTIYKKLG